MGLERRFAPLELRMDDEGEKRLLRGYAAVFDELSQELWGFRERIAHGAFAETLSDDIRALWNHNTDFPLGRTKNETLGLEEDENGLRIWIEPPVTQLANDFVESIRRGDVDQMSFAFRTLEDTWDMLDDETLVRTLLKVKLYEVSPVTFPAYPQTNVQTRSGLSVFGDVPEIPAEFRRASDSADELAAKQARARVKWRQRYLKIVE